VSFEVAADAYDRFMGRYSVPLATHFVEFAHVLPGQRAIDVGCGPGAVTGELVTRLGAEVVAAVDPSEQFVAAVRERHPGVDVRRAFAEDLPFADNEFDVSLAQLVVHFMADPLAGLGEMVRVTRPDGLVVASVWDHAGGRSPISLFWAAAREIDPKVDDESDLAGAREGHLAELFHAVGLRAVQDGELSVRVELGSFDDWWEPFRLGVGPAGTYAAGLEPEQLAALKERCRKLVPEPFRFEAVAWAARGEV
jgi:SAM-dependent methyltransferase